jgi:hypothetical protein
MLCSRIMRCFPRCDAEVRRCSGIAPITCIWPQLEAISTRTNNNGDIMDNEKESQESK